jgi:hypothetical protein
LVPHGVHAQELPQPSDLLAFNGQATIISDSDGDTPSVDLVGGSGTYSFDTQPTGFCVGYSDAAEVGVTVGSTSGPAGCRVTVSSATGAFTNTVCGTGTAGGTANISGADTATSTFNITFVATIGVVTGSTSDANDPEPQDQLVGVAQIGPPLNPRIPPDDTGDCASGFTSTVVIVSLEGSPLPPPL